MGMLFPVRLMKNSWAAPAHPHPHPIQDEASAGPRPPFPAGSQASGPDLAQPGGEAPSSKAGACHR